MMPRVTRPPINSAEFNIREIAKQMLLLEDHLSDDDKYCEDCILKHLMSVEALGEEAIAMEPRGQYSANCKFLSSKARDWIVRFGDGADKRDLSQEIRKIRKQLVALTFDPRKKS